jgi:hypothetical protein
LYTAADVDNGIEESCAVDVAGGATAMCDTASDATEPDAGTCADVDCTFTAYEPAVSYTTYRLRLLLPETHRSLYALQGSADNEPHIPASYLNTIAAPATRPPAQSFFESNAVTFNDVMLSSFVSLGRDVGTGSPAETGSSGDALPAWTGGAALSLGPAPSDDASFAFFCMSPARLDEGLPSLSLPILILYGNSYD